MRKTCVCRFYCALLTPPFISRKIFPESHNWMTRTVIAFATFCPVVIPTRQLTVNIFTLPTRIRTRVKFRQIIYRPLWYSTTLNWTLFVPLYSHTQTTTFKCQRRIQAVLLKNFYCRENIKQLWQICSSVCLSICPDVLCVKRKKTFCSVRIYSNTKGVRESFFFMPVWRKVLLDSLISMTFSYFRKILSSTIPILVHTALNLGPFSPDATKESYSQSL